MSAPNFELNDFRTNQTVKLADFTGKPVMLTFWVSWCPDCQKDLPQKAAFYRSLERNSLGFVTINVTGREPNPEAGPEFTKAHELPFPVLIDNGTETYDSYKCNSVPTTIIIDANHQITHRFGDQASFYEIVRALSMIMK